MSNPFAVLHVEDGPKRGGKGGKSQGPKLTPAEQKALKEEREAARARQQQTQETISQTSFVVIDENLEGFIEVDRKPGRSDKEDKLSKEEFNQLSKKNRGELIDQNRRKGSNNQRGGNRGGKKNWPGNRGPEKQNRGGNRNNNNRTGKQNNNRGGNKNNNRGKQQQQQGRNANRGGENFVNPPVKDNRAKDEQKEAKYVIKKDRKPRNPSKSVKRAGGGEFNWDDPIDAGLEEVVEEVKEVLPEELEVETLDAEYSEEWVPEEVPEDSDHKVVDPHVKRVGLSAYLAAKQEEEAKAAELTQKLAATNQRKLDIVIPSEANLNKKGRTDVDENDAFFFAPKEHTKKGKQRKNQGEVSNELNINFKIKKHRGYNMPRERKESSDQEEGNRGGNRQNRNNNNRGNRNNRNRGGNRGGNRKPRFNNASFPPLGGASTAPAVAPTWPPLETEQEE